MRPQTAKSGRPKTASKGRNARRSQSLVVVVVVVVVIVVVGYYFEKFIWICLVLERSTFIDNLDFCLGILRKKTIYLYFDVLTQEGFPFIASLV